MGNAWWYTFNSIYNAFPDCNLLMKSNYCDIIYYKIIVQTIYMYIKILIMITNMCCLVRLCTISRLRTRADTRTSGHDTAKTNNNLYIYIYTYVYIYYNHMVLSSTHSQNAKQSTTYGSRQHAHHFFHQQYMFFYFHKIMW